MLPKTHRVTKRGDFEFLFKKGKALNSPFYTIRYSSNRFPHSRIGIIVSNKISKKAVVRNKIKRRMRAISAHYIGTIPLNLDIIIIAKHAIVNTDYQELARALSVSFFSIAKGDGDRFYRGLPKTSLPRS